MAVQVNHSEREMGKLSRLTIRIFKVQQSQICIGLYNQC